MNPAINGPVNDEIEKPSESRLKLAVRCSGADTTPTACWVPMKIAMKPVPINMAAGYSTVRLGIDAASNTPTVASKQPTINGLRMPMRSITRPMGTASIMGNRANNAINVPTVNAEACSDSAYSAVVTRAAPSATCAVTATAINRKSGEDKDTVKKLRVLHLVADSLLSENVGV